MKMCFTVLTMKEAAVKLEVNYMVIVGAMVLKKRRRLQKVQRVIKNINIVGGKDYNATKFFLC